MERSDYAALRTDRPLRSECITMLSNAIRQIQQEMPHAPKDMVSSAYDKTGKHPYKYASLQSIIDTARPFLIRFGLTMTHSIEGDVMIALLNHIQSNQYMEARYKLIYKPEDPRSFSAAVTFGMKDTYRMMLGMVADDDTDGYMPG